MPIKACVLLSGGLDSNLALAELVAKPVSEVERVTALSFDYNQSNSDELHSAITLCKQWGVPHVIQHLTLDEVDTHKEIPARNLLFLTFALAWCLRNGYNAIAIGAEPDSTYTDSSVQFITKAQALFALWDIQVLVPVKHLTNKVALVKRALDLGVPLDLCHSSLSNEINGECKTSRRFLDAIRTVCPNVPAHEMLAHLGTIKRRFLKPNVLQVGYGDDPMVSFKFAPALFAFACDPVLASETPSTTVFSSGSWATAIKHVGSLLGKDLSRMVFKVPALLDEMLSQQLNTSSPWAVWGTKQALSVLPRPRYCKQVAVRVVQGHLKSALQELGYEVTTPEQCNGLVVETQL